MAKAPDNVIPFPRPSKKAKNPIELINEIINNSTPVVEKQSQSENNAPVPLSFQQTGDNNIQIASLTIHNTTHDAQKRVSPSIPPRTAEHISDTDAKAVHDLISYLANIDKNKDGKPNFGKWWKRLKDKFKISSYYYIPASRIDEVLSWGETQKFLLRDQLKTSDYQEWRKMYYAAIYAKGKNIGLDNRDKLYTIISIILDRDVSSMRNLSDSDLKLVHRTIMSSPD